jgi:hypothetical protein
MSDICEFKGMRIGWNHGRMQSSIHRDFPLYIESDEDERIIGITFEQAKWLSEQLQPIIEKADRYKMYLQLRDEFEEKVVTSIEIK